MKSWARTDNLRMFADTSHIPAILTPRLLRLLLLICDGFVTALTSISLPFYRHVTGVTDPEGGGGVFPCPTSVSISLPYPDPALQTPGAPLRPEVLTIRPLDALRC